MAEFFVSLWKTVRSNPVFVAFEGGAGGAILNFADDAIRSGGMDLSREGIHKLAAAAIIGGITAIRLLYRPSPGSTPNSK